VGRRQAHQGNKGAIQPIGRKDLSSKFGKAVHLYLIIRNIEWKKGP